MSLLYGHVTNSSIVTILSSFPKRTNPLSVTTPGRWAPGIGKTSPSGTKPAVFSVELKNVSFCLETGPENQKVVDEKRPPL